MTVACPECRSMFRVDPAKVPATGVRARCSVCGGVIAITGGTLPVLVTPVASSGAVPVFGAGGAPAAPLTGATGATAATSPPSVSGPPSVPPAHPPSALPAALGARLRGGALPTAGRPPINPFLRADPSQRARRLARALVSDLVAYHPQKREEGLRDGTLRQLFRDEIKKSYEEYVEQMGREAAEAAPHFQDALNDILAGGRRLF